MSEGRYVKSLGHLAEHIKRIRTIHKIELSDTVDTYLAKRYILLCKKAPVDFDEYIIGELGIAKKVHDGLKDK